MTRQSHSAAANATIAGLASRGDATERVTALLAQEATTPRMPCFLSVNGTLLSHALSPDHRNCADGPRAEALRRMMRIGWIGGVEQALEDVIRQIEQVWAPPWLVSLSEAVTTKAQKGYASAMESWRRAEAEVASGDDPSAAIELLMARIDLELSERHGKAAERAARQLLDTLEGLEGAHPGERYHAWNALGIAHVSQNQPDAAVEAARQALHIAEALEATEDLVMATVAMVPPLLHLERCDDALSALEAGINRVTDVEEQGTAEMVLRNLQLQTLAQANRVADAIRAGFLAIERAGAVGTVDHHVGFVAHVSTQYYKAGAFVDAWNVLDSAAQGLAKRGDEPTALARVRDLLDALALDLGPERHQAVVAECEARRARG